MYSMEVINVAINYKEILLDSYEYSEYMAEITSIDMDNMNETCKLYFDLAFLKEAHDDLVYRDFSVNMLIKDFGMTLPAAVLVISQLMTDYDKYSILLRSGIK